VVSDSRHRTTTRDVVRWYSTTPSVRRPTLGPHSWSRWIGSGDVRSPRRTAARSATRSGRRGPCTSATSTRRGCCDWPRRSEREDSVTRTCRLTTDGRATTETSTSTPTSQSTAGIIGDARYGALGHVPPPRLPASYFGDHSLYGKCTKTTQFLRNFYQFFAHFCRFLPTVFVRE